MLDARDALCDRLGKPRSTTLHWAANVKRHDERKFVSQALSSLPAAYTFVLVDKSSLHGRHVLGDRVSMYNYAIRRLLERVSWFVDSRHGTAHVTFAHVRRFPYHRLESYLRLLRDAGRKTEIRWRALPHDPRFGTPERRRLLQFADLAAGCLNAAVSPDRFGNVEGSYLEEIAGRLYRRGGADIRSYGLNVVGDRTCIERLPWWDTVSRA